jgi:hypothetical protein
VDAPVRPDRREFYTTASPSPVQRRSCEYEPEEHR